MTSFVLQMLDPLSSAENSVSGSCQSLDRSADRYRLVGTYVLKSKYQLYFYKRLFSISNFLGEN